MNIKVLGTRCAKCHTVEQNVRKAIDELKIQANIEKVEDIMQIMKYGVMTTPALIINDKVIFSGKNPSLNEIKDIIQKAV